jgi:short subunit dehydrogenase-like uncharacterized protein
MITVIGATGFTGMLIAQELRRMGCPARLAGRDETKLRELAAALDSHYDTIQVDVTDAAGVSRALDNTTVVINCAGPFTGLSEPVVREAARRGVHYLDTTGEQAFIRYIFETLDDEARRSGAALVPGCAFEYALGDAGAALAADKLQPCDEVQIAYAMKGSGTSRGTRMSIVNAMGAPGVLYCNSRLVPIPSPPVSREVSFPRAGRRTATSLPFGEVIMVPRHVNTRDVITLMSLPVPAVILSAVSSMAGLMLRSPLAGSLIRVAGRGSFGPSNEERKKSEFEILCTARAGNQDRSVAITGCDPYGLTARIAAHFAFLLHNGAAAGSGALSPSMVAGPQAIIEATGAAGVLWKVGAIS